jgi:hypothetical protein
MGVTAKWVALLQTPATSVTGLISSEAVKRLAGPLEHRSSERFSLN